MAAGASTLWPGGRFVTTQLLVRTQFLQDHPDLVDDLLTGQIEANDFISKNPDEAKKLIGDWIASFTQTEVPQVVLDKAWQNLTFTNDPIADSLVGSADHAIELGLIDDVDLGNLYDLDPLNKLLAAAGEHQVTGPSKQ